MIVTPIKQVDGFVKSCIISSASAMEILQSCTNPSRWCYRFNMAKMAVADSDNYDLPNKELYFQNMSMN